MKKYQGTFHKGILCASLPAPANLPLNKYPFHLKSQIPLHLSCQNAPLHKGIFPDCNQFPHTDTASLLP